MTSVSPPVILPAHDYGFPEYHAPSVDGGPHSRTEA
jgi:hypothetical protein